MSDTETRSLIQALPETEIDAGRDGENLRETPQNLRNKEFVRAPVMGNETVAPHRHAEGGQAQHHEPARVELAGQNDVDGSPRQRRRTRREDCDAGLPGTEAADIPEKEQRQIDRGEDSDARDERQKT